MTNEFDVYVPAVSLTSIDPRSGIVSLPATAGADRIEVYFESNRHGASNIVTFADRLHHAAGRLKEKYPTIARALLPATDLTRVGTYYYDHGRFEVADGGDLFKIAKWLDLVDAQQFLDGDALHREFRATHAGAR